MINRDCFILMVVILDKRKNYFCLCAAISARTHKAASTFSALNMETDTCASSVDPDETARNEPSHQDLPCLPFFFFFFFHFILD